MSYLDCGFDFPNMNVHSWFINESANENNVSLAVRFNLGFCSDMIIQLALLVLCSRNPNNYFLWISFLNQAVRMFLASKTYEDEEQSIRRYHQNSTISGFWFYFYHISKIFVVLNWKFLPKNYRFWLKKIILRKIFLFLEIYIKSRENSRLQNPICSIFILSSGIILPRMAVKRSLA